MSGMRDSVNVPSAVVAAAESAAAPGAAVPRGASRRHVSRLVRAAAAFVAAACLAAGGLALPAPAANADETPSSAFAAPETADGGSLPALTGTVLDDEDCNPTSADQIGARLLLTHDGSTMYAIAQRDGYVCKIDTSSMTVEAKVKVDLGDLANRVFYTSSARLSADESMLILPDAFTIIRTADMSIVSLPLGAMNSDFSADGSSVTFYKTTGGADPSAARRFVTFSTADGSQLGTVDVTLPWTARQNPIVVGVSSDHATWCIYEQVDSKADKWPYRMLLVNATTGAVTELPVSYPSSQGTPSGLRVANGMALDDYAASGTPVPFDTLYALDATLDEGGETGMVSVNLATGEVSQVDGGVASSREMSADGTIAVATSDGAMSFYSLPGGSQLASVPTTVDMDGSKLIRTGVRLTGDGSKAVIPYLRQDDENSNSGMIGMLRVLSFGGKDSPDGVGYSDYAVDSPQVASIALDDLDNAVLSDDATALYFADSADSSIKKISIPSDAGENAGDASASAASASGSAASAQGDSADGQAAADGWRVAAIAGVAAVAAVAAAAVVVIVRRRHNDTDRSAADHSDTDRSE